jgi:anti-sigma factor RsiW
MDFLEGELSAELRTAVADHVAGCARCTAFVDSYRAAPEILRRATAASLPSDLAAELMRAVRDRFGEGAEP